MEAKGTLVKASIISRETTLVEARISGILKTAKSDPGARLDNPVTPLFDAVMAVCSQMLRAQ